MENANSGSRRALLLALVSPLLMAANLSTLEPAIGGAGLLSLDSPGGLAPGQWHGRTWFFYAHDPLVRAFSDGSRQPVVGSQLRADAVVTLGLVRGIDVALDLPVLLRQWQTQPLSGGDPGGSGLGDLRLLARWEALPARIFGLGLAGALQLTLPTGSQRQLLGQGGVGITPQLLLSVPLGAAVGLARIGYSWRPSRPLEDATVGQLLPLGIGARLPLGGQIDAWQLLGEVQGRLQLPPNNGGRWGGVELLAGARRPWSTGWEITLGLGYGLGHGLGVPQARALLAIGYGRPTADRDDDGLPDSADACPDRAETYNGYADLDGCPDVLPELERGPEPEPPGRPDHDGDGLFDDEDACPFAAEDWDGQLDGDGCPDPDRDHDGVPEPQDQCPDAPETINGVNDADGCPDVGAGATTYVENVGIELSGTVQFNTGHASLKDASLPLLDQVALQLLAHPSPRRLRIEGHTDNQGDAQANLRLSQARAETVRDYLIARGVGGAGLVPIGLGEARPLADNATAEGRTRNRRVTFVLE